MLEYVREAEKTQSQEYGSYSLSGVSQSHKVLFWVWFSQKDEHDAYSGEIVH